MIRIKPPWLFYADTIAAALRPFAEKARSPDPASSTLPLTPALAKRQLILDGKMTNVPAEGKWTREEAVPGWWNLFFRGATSCREEGEVLTIPFRGTMAARPSAFDVLGFQCLPLTKASQI